MPSLNISFLGRLDCNIVEYPVFIETGTHKGDTILSVEPYFNTLYTIELAQNYYELAKSKYNGAKIKFILGDSSIKLKEIFENLDQNIILFLDGHWSGGNTARGNKDCPLVEEIRLIGKYCKNSAIIIIDDYRLFSKGPKDGYNEDWSEINKDILLNILGTRVDKVYHLDSECAKDDRLIIHILPQ
jgi:hypothetical protein